MDPKYDDPKQSSGAGRRFPAERPPSADFDDLDLPPPHPRAEAILDWLGDRAVTFCKFVDAWKRRSPLPVDFLRRYYQPNADFDGLAGACASASVIDERHDIHDCAFELELELAEALRAGSFGDLSKLKQAVSARSMVGCVRLAKVLLKTCGEFAPDVLHDERPTESMP